MVENDNIKKLFGYLMWVMIWSVFKEHCLMSTNQNIYVLFSTNQMINSASVLLFVVLLLTTSCIFLYISEYTHFLYILTFVCIHSYFYKCILWTFNSFDMQGVFSFLQVPLYTREIAFRSIRIPIKFSPNDFTIYFVDYDIF